MFGIGVFIAQTAPQLFRATFLATRPGESKLKN
jgi:hypothetical protein